MVGYNTVNRIRPFIRKHQTLKHRIRGRPHVKTKTRRINYLQKNIPLNTHHFTQAHSKPTLVKLNTLQKRINKRTKKMATIHAKKQSRRQRVAKRKTREWKDIVKQINDPDILENIGVYVNRDHKLVSSEGEITEEQYDQLIEELQNKLEDLDPENDEYEENILNKAISFVEESQRNPAPARGANEPDEINSLDKMMASLSTGR